MSIINTGALAATPGPASPAASNGFYTPSDLRRAYKLTTAARNGGKGKVVAIVDAFKDPNAARDLATYRSHYHLPACTTANGCLKIVNQNGKKSPLPTANASWAVEESLDLDMVSAICPNCHIVLFEAKTPSTVNLGTAVNTAAHEGIKYISNSWSGGEFIGQDFFNHYFNHPGVAVDFASGDFGYGAAYPTDTQFVTAIGGTSLRHAAGRRGWTESAWGDINQPDGTGSGCSALEAKPSWQHADAKEPGGCLNRTENDVSAVANPNTGVVVWDSYKESGKIEVGGTSAATPIVTGVYALAGSPTKGTYPAEYPYLHQSHLFDVTSGANGRCEANRKYLCHGVKGYDGPTGLGTPNGTGAFTDKGAHRVTLVDPGTEDVRVSAHVSFKITGLDSKGGSLHYSAAGLPGGLTIGSASGTVSGTLPGSPGTFHVTVTARNGAVSGTTHFTIVVVPSLTNTDETAGEVTLTGGSRCLDASAAPTVKIHPCADNSGQQWLYRSDGNPGSSGQLIFSGTQCLGVTGGVAKLASCNGAPSQDWAYLGFGDLGSLANGNCLAAASLTNGGSVVTAPCTGTPSQTWTLPLGTITAGTSPASLCLVNPGNSSSSGTKLKVNTCASGSDHWFALNGDGTIGSASGLCLSGNESFNSGTAIVVEFCDSTQSNPDFSELWIPGPGGELINADSGRCLADPGNGGAGSTVLQEDCYGEAGEVWGLN
jgi:hypothetical protein